MFCAQGGAEIIALYERESLIWKFGAQLCKHLRREIDSSHLQIGESGEDGFQFQACAAAQVQKRMDAFRQQRSHTGVAFAATFHVVEHVFVVYIHARGKKRAHFFQ